MWTPLLVLLYYNCNLEKYNTKENFSVRTFLKDCIKHEINNLRHLVLVDEIMYNIFWVYKQLTPWTDWKLVGNCLATLCLYRGNRFLKYTITVPRTPRTNDRTLKTESLNSLPNDTTARTNNKTDSLSTYRAEVTMVVSTHWLASL